MENKEQTTLRTAEEIYQSHLEPYGIALSSKFGQASLAAMQEFASQVAQLRSEKLQKFKDYVHDRLDKMGVPSDPEPENNLAHGCRIEGRLNALQSEKEQLQKENDQLKQENERMRDVLSGANRWLRENSDLKTDARKILILIESVL